MLRFGLILSLSGFMFTSLAFTSAGLASANGNSMQTASADVSLYKWRSNRYRYCGKVRSRGTELETIKSVRGVKLGVRYHRIYSPRNLRRSCGTVSYVKVDDVVEKQSPQAPKKQVSERDNEKFAQHKTFKVTGDSVNLRSRASDTSSVICSLREGDTGVAMAESAGFIKVKITDQDNRSCYSESGWVFHEFVGYQQPTAQNEESQENAGPAEEQTEPPLQQAEVKVEDKIDRSSEDTEVEVRFSSVLLPSKKPEKMAEAVLAKAKEQTEYFYVQRPQVNFRDQNSKQIIKNCSLRVNDRLVTNGSDGIYTKVTVVDRSSACNGKEGLIASRYIGARVGGSSVGLFASNDDVRGGMAKIATKSLQDLFTYFRDQGVPEAGLRRLINHYEANYDSYPNKNVLTLVDFREDISSAKPRQYIMVLNEDKPRLIKTQTAHGQRTGYKYAERFSNRPNSKASSTGFFRTGEIYYGSHGKSMKLDGFSETNFNARCRYVVVHKASYMSLTYIRRKGRAGRSWGCPALNSKVHYSYVNLSKEGSAYYIWDGRNRDKISDRFDGERYSCTKSL